MTFFQTVVVTIIGGLVASAAGVLAAFRTRSTDRKQAAIDRGRNELDSRRVESEAYANAQKITDDVVVGLRTEISRLRTELKEERDARAEDNRRHALEIADLRKTISKLSSDLADLDVTRATRHNPEKD